MCYVRMYCLRIIFVNDANDAYDLLDTEWRLLFSVYLSVISVFMIPSYTLAYFHVRRCWEPGPLGLV